MGDTYEIPIKTEGVELSIAQLTELAQKLIAAETETTSFDAAIAGTANAMAAAKAATAALTSEFGRNSEEALAARTQQEAIAQTLKTLRSGAAAEIRAEEAALKAEAAAAKDAAKQQEALEKAVKKTTGAQGPQKVATTNVGEALEKVSSVLGRFGGQTGQLAGQSVAGVGSLAKLGTAFGGVAAAGIGTVAVIGLITTGIAAAIVKTVEWGISLADAARDSHLHTEALAASRAELVNLEGILPGVAANTNLATDEIESLASTLADAKVSAANMPVALNAVATAEAALGKGGASKFIEQLRSGKTSVGELAKEVDAKFGGIVVKKLLGLSAQTQTFKRLLGETFGGLKIDGFLAGLHTIVELFDSSTASGRFLKDIFEGLFQPFVDGAAAAIPVIEAFILGVEAGILRVYIAFKPAIDAVKEFVGAADESDIDWLNIAFEAAQALTVALLGVVAVTGAVATAFLAVPAAFAALGNLIGQAAILGTQIVAGLVQGIVSGAASVVSAITSVVSGAIATAKSLLGVHSPSTVFAEIGGHTAEGFAGGVKGGTARASDALELLTAPPDLARGGSSSVSSVTSSKGGNTYNFTFSGVTKEDASWIEECVRRVLTDTIESDAAQLGAEAA